MQVAVCEISVEVSVYNERVGNSLQSDDVESTTVDIATVVVVGSACLQPAPGKKASLLLVVLFAVTVCAV